MYDKSCTITAYLKDNFPLIYITKDPTNINNTKAIIEKPTPYKILKGYLYINK